MKKLFLAVAFVATSLAASAVTWDFSTLVPAGNSTGYSATTTINGLSLVPGTSSTPVTNFSIIMVSQTAKTVGGVSFTGYSKTGGAGFESTNDSVMPTKRYYAFTTTSAGTITVYFKTGTTGSPRNCIISNGTAILAKATESAGAGTTVTYAASAGVTYYIYGNNNITVYGIDFTGTVSTGVKEVVASSLSKVGNELVNPENEEVEIYSVMGAKILTSSLSNIDIAGLPQGFYVAKTSKGSLKFIK